jgi:diguanylate cyclase (GGDEF)-like protein
MSDETIVTIVNTKPEELGAPRRHKDACLIVIYGQDLGRKYNIVGHELRIGRAAVNDICIAQDAVSREHAILVVDDHGVKVSDNESTNGTYVNDNKVREVYLRDGDLLKVGRSIFKFLSGDNIESSYHEEVFRLSTTDGLTQVFNRRYFSETLEREVNRARRYKRPLALVIFDIDHFKKTNDTHGHRAGDYVLRRVADLVSQRARRVDVVARYGGEEFVIILPEIDLASSLGFAEDVRAMVEAEEVIFEGTTIPVRVSVGVASLDEGCDSGDDLLKLADRRLFRAKETGRNRVVAEG